MKTAILAALAASGAVSAQECVDPRAIKITIYHDDQCTQVDEKSTAENVLSDEDAQTFNDCHDIKIGKTKAYMQNLCLKLSFTIQFFKDEFCTEVLDVDGIRSSYIYEWETCYKRSNQHYMRLHKPVWPKKTNEDAKPGIQEGSGASGLLATATALALVGTTLY